MPMFVRLPPPSISACVTVRWAVQVIEEPASGATVSVVEGQLIPGGSSMVASVTVTLVSVTLPVFVTGSL